jgi:hypothetical protein
MSADLEEREQAQGISEEDGQYQRHTYHESNLFIEDRTHLPVLAATNDEGDGRSRMSQ